VIRTPLRPLARVLKARETGENPAAIEAENKRRRHEEMHDKAKNRAEGRLLVLGGVFFLAFSAIGLQMGVMASTEAEEPTAVATGNPIIGQRADIVDRNGRILATNFDTYALYAQPPQLKARRQSWPRSSPSSTARA
jgi:cell division protein FtsI (penicillin-binding protein 3)